MVVVQCLLLISVKNATVLSQIIKLCDSTNLKINYSYKMLYEHFRRLQGRR